MADLYVSISNFRLCIMDPVHKIGIRLATGAFRTSRLVLVHEESWTSTLLVEECPVPITWLRSPFVLVVMLQYLTPLSAELPINHNSLSTCRFTVSSACTVTCFSIAINYSPQTNPHWDVIRPTYHLRILRQARGVTPVLTCHVVSPKYFPATQTIRCCVLTGRLFKDRHVYFHIWRPGFFPIASTVVTSFILPNCMPFTELSCSFGSSCANVISCAHNLYVPCRLSVLTLQTTPYRDSVLRIPSL